MSLTEVEYPRFELKFGGKNEGRKQEIIEVAEFIGVKSFRAKGRRLSNYSVADIRELDPVVRSEAAPPPPETENGSEEDFPPQQHTPDDPAQMKLDL